MEAAKWDVSRPEHNVTLFLVVIFIVENYWNKIYSPTKQYIVERSKWYKSGKKTFSDSNKIFCIWGMTSKYLTFAKRKDFHLTCWHKQYIASDTILTATYVRIVNMVTAWYEHYSIASIMNKAKIELWTYIVHIMKTKIDRRFAYFSVTSKSQLSFFPLELTQSLYE